MIPAFPFIHRVFILPISPQWAQRFAFDLSLVAVFYTSFSHLDLTPLESRGKPGANPSLN